MSLLTPKQKLTFIVFSLCFLLFGVAGGLYPQIQPVSKEALEGRSDWQLAKISYQFALGKDYKKSHEAALLGLKEGYQRPKQAHWFLSHLAWLESNQSGPSEATTYYKDLINLRNSPLDQANYIWALGRLEARQKIPKTAQEALEELEASQEKITEFTLELQNSPSDFASLQLEAWRLAKRVEGLIRLLEEPGS